MLDENLENVIENILKADKEFWSEKTEYLAENRFLFK